MAEQTATDTTTTTATADTTTSAPATDTTTTAAPATTTATAAPAVQQPAPTTKPAASAPAKAAEPTQQELDIRVGKNICPNDDLSNVALEDALAVLRTTDVTTPADLAKAQVTLYNVISRFLVRKDEADCFAFLRNLLAYISFNKDAHFSAKTAFRAFDMLGSLNASQQTEFGIILKILIDTAEPSTRGAAAKAMNWKSIQPEFVQTFADTVLGRLMKFYNVK